MKSIFASSYFLYLGDVMFVTLLTFGVGFCIGALIRRSRRYMILDLDAKQLNRLVAWAIAVSFINLIAFKLDILASGGQVNKLILTGNHGSVQFSTAGEFAAFALCGYGAYRWGLAAKRHLRLIREL
jgi:Ca2+/H+ antiporter